MLSLTVQKRIQSSSTIKNKNKTKPAKYPAITGHGSVCDLTHKVMEKFAWQLELPMTKIITQARLCQWCKRSDQGRRVHTQEPNRCSQETWTTSTCHHEVVQIGRLEDQSITAWLITLRTDSAKPCSIIGAKSMKLWLCSWLRIRNSNRQIWIGSKIHSNQSAPLSLRLWRSCLLRVILQKWAILPLQIQSSNSERPLVSTKSKLPSSRTRNSRSTL